MPVNLDSVAKYYLLSILPLLRAHAESEVTPQQQLENYLRIVI